MSNNFDIIKALWLRKERKRRAQKTIEGALPLTYTAKKAGTLTDYRIYGQTVDGESVGDRTGNLFDGEWEQGSIDNAGGMLDNTRRVRTIVDVDSGGTYTIQTNQLIRIVYAYYFDGTKYSKIANLLDRADGVRVGIVNIPNNANAIAVSLMNLDGTDILPADVEWTMLNSGSEALPYEPYGYRVPVTINDVTTNLYLPEQIKMVGDEAEYIDYAEQKQYFVGGTSVDVTLPALPTIAGTNTLSVGTEVQPSKVMVRGKLKE